MSGLSEQEREVLERVIRWHMEAHREQPQGGHLSAGVKNVMTAVERIVAAREAQMAERIAWVIETRNARCGSGSPYVEAYHDGYDDAREHMARMAREIGGAS